jgi:hypothetical protein
MSKFGIDLITSAKIILRNMQSTKTLRKAEIGQSQWKTVKQHDKVHYYAQDQYRFAKSAISLEKPTPVLGIVENPGYLTKPIIWGYILTKAEEEERESLNTWKISPQNWQDCVGHVTQPYANPSSANVTIKPENHGNGG